ncbi:MAG: hypothetical protein LUH51_06400 [Firmicutes bacterium]|nr:hypothetical protein [Bacillota bacterium]
MVTSTSDLAEGDTVIIVAKDYAKAMGEQKSNNRNAVDITKDADANTATCTDEALQELTIGAGLTEGTWSFSTGSGYLYAASSSSNYLRTETELSNNSSWNISIDADTGSATILATGDNTRNLMRYNSSGLFGCYASGQLDICIYKLTSAASVPTEMNAGVTAVYSNSLALGIALKQSDVDAAYVIDSFTVVFAYTDKDGVDQTDTVEFVDGSTISNILAGSYVALFAGQYAYQYTEDVTCTLYYGSTEVDITSTVFADNVVDGSLVICMNDYMTYAAANGTTEEAKALASAAQAYCAAALAYHG